jgi:hypothetical protein
MATSTGFNKYMEANIQMEEKAQMTWESWVDSIERVFRATHGYPDNTTSSGAPKLLIGSPGSDDIFPRRMSFNEDSTEVGTDSSCDSENDHSDVIFDNQLLPSIGSIDHAKGTCHRCCFFPKGRCQNGYDCTFCHFEHDKRPRKKKEMVKQAVTQRATPNVAPTEGAVKHMPISPPGFFGKLPPGLEDVVAPVVPTMAPAKSPMSPMVPATPPGSFTPPAAAPAAAGPPGSFTPPGTWKEPVTKPKSRKEAVTLTLDGGLEGLPETPKPHQRPAPECNDKVKPESCAKQYNVTGLDPLLPVKKSVPAFLCNY